MQITRVVLSFENLRAEEDVFEHKTFKNFSTKMRALVNIGGVGVTDDSLEKDLTHIEAKRIFVDTKGDRMDGSLNMISNRITELGNPQETHDAVNMSFLLKQFSILRQ